MESLVDNQEDKNRKVSTLIESKLAEVSGSLCLRQREQLWEEKEKK
jgi:hypothetical protein